MDEQLTFRVPRALARALARRAREEGVKRSHLVRQALAQFLGLAAGTGAPSTPRAVQENAGRPYAPAGALRYKVAIRRTDEGFSVSVPGLPGCWSQGGTEEEALANIRDAIREYLAVRDELLRGATVRQVDAG